MRLQILAFFVALQLSAIAQNLASFGNNQHDTLPSTVVLDAEVYKGNLYLGGKFDLINGVSTSGFCKYDGTNTSSPWPISALAFEPYNNLLAIAYIDAQGASVGFWNDTILQPSGLNILPTNSLFDLKTFNGNLYLTGYFSANNKYYILAKYSGTSWTYHGEVSPLPKSAGLSMAVHNNMLHIGGAFDTINGNFFGTSIVAFNGTTFLPVNSVYSVATSIFSNSSEIIAGLEQQPIGNPPFAKTIGTSTSYLPFSGFANAEVGRVFRLGNTELYAAINVRGVQSHSFPSGVLYVKQNQNYIPLCDSLFGSTPNSFLPVERPRDLIRGVVFYQNQYIIYGGFKSTSAYAQQPYNLLAVIGSVLGEEENIGAQNVALFPNPTRDFLTFKNFDNTERYTIYNVQGVTVKTGPLSAQINISNLPTGSYVFQREGKDSVLRQRFVKSDE